MVRPKWLYSDKKASEKTQKYLRSTPTPALHFGCGINRFKGWLNLDIGGKADIACDFTKPLRFLTANSFQYCYSEHVLEHFPRKQALKMTQEIYSSLKPGGVFRVAIPDLDSLLEQYSNYKKDLYEEVHRGFASFYGEAFYTRGELLDISMRGWGHQYMYNEEDLTLLLKSVGFRSIVRKQHRDSDHAIFQGIETRPAQQSSLILEACK